MPFPKPYPRPISPPAARAEQAPPPRNSRQATPSSATGLHPPPPGHASFRHWNTPLPSDHALFALPTPARLGWPRPPAYLAVQPRPIMARPRPCNRPRPLCSTTPRLPPRTVPLHQTTPPFRPGIHQAPPTPLRSLGPAPCPLKPRPQGRPRGRSGARWGGGTRWALSFGVRVNAGSGGAMRDVGCSRNRGARG